MEVITEFISNIISTIGNIFGESKTIYNILGFILSLVIVHKAVYYTVGLFFTRKFKEAKKKHKYAILIAARNEKISKGQNKTDFYVTEGLKNKLLTSWEEPKKEEIDVWYELER